MVRHLHPMENTGKKSSVQRTSFLTKGKGITGREEFEGGAWAAE